MILIKKTCCNCMIEPSLNFGEIYGRPLLSYKYDGILLIFITLLYKGIVYFNKDRLLCFYVKSSLLDT